MNIALITASGIGSRVKQDIPKQFLNVYDKPLFIYTLEAFQNSPEIDEICIVILKGWENMMLAYAKQFNITKLKYWVYGGDTGQQSIFNGVETIYNKNKDKDDIIIMIHDGNRPLVSNDIIRNNIRVCKQFGSAVTCIPCVEVIMESENKKYSNTIIDRDSVLRTQTPHSYYLKELYESMQEARKNLWEGFAAIPCLMNKLGKTTYFSEGSEKNIKVTTLDDLDIFKCLLKVEHSDWLK